MNQFSGRQVVTPYCTPYSERVCEYCNASLPSCYSITLAQAKPPSYLIYKLYLKCCEPVWPMPHGMQNVGEDACPEGEGQEEKPWTKLFAYAGKSAVPGAMLQQRRRFASIKFAKCSKECMAVKQRTVHCKDINGPESCKEQ